MPKADKFTIQGYPRGNPLNTPAMKEYVEAVEAAGAALKDARAIKKAATKENMKSAEEGVARAKAASEAAKSALKEAREKVKQEADKAVVEAAKEEKAQREATVTKLSSDAKKRRTIPNLGNDINIIQEVGTQAEQAADVILVNLDEKKNALDKNSPSYSQDAKKISNEKTLLKLKKNNVIALMRRARDLKQELIDLEEIGGDINRHSELQEEIESLERDIRSRSDKITSSKIKINIKGAKRKENETLPFEDEEEGPPKRKQGIASLENAEQYKPKPVLTTKTSGFLEPVKEDTRSLAQIIQDSVDAGAEQRKAANPEWYAGEQQRKDAEAAARRFRVNMPAGEEQKIYQGKQVIDSLKNAEEYSILNVKDLSEASKNTSKNVAGTGDPNIRPSDKFNLGQHIATHSLAYNAAKTIEGKQHHYNEMLRVFDPVRHQFQINKLKKDLEHDIAVIKGRTATTYNNITVPEIESGFAPNPDLQIESEAHQDRGEAGNNAAKPNGDALGNFVKDPNNKGQAIPVDAIGKSGPNIEQVVKANPNPNDDIIKQFQPDPIDYKRELFMTAYRRQYGDKGPTPSDPNNQMGNIAEAEKLKSRLNLQKSDLRKMGLSDYEQLPLADLVLKPVNEKEKSNNTFANLNWVLSRADSKLGNFSSLKLQQDAEDKMRYGRTYTNTARLPKTKAAIISREYADIYNSTNNRMIPMSDRYTVTERYPSSAMGYGLVHGPRKLSELEPSFDKARRTNFYDNELIYPSKIYDLNTRKMESI